MSAVHVSLAPPTSPAPSLVQTQGRGCEVITAHYCWPGWPGLAELAASSHQTPKTCQDVADKEAAWAAAAAASGMMTDDKLVTGGPSSYSCPAPPRHTT